MRLALRISLMPLIFLTTCGPQAITDKVITPISTAKILSENWPIAAKIIADVKGTSGELLLCEDSNNRGDTLHFILLKVNGLEFSSASESSKYLTASYCATQLYKLIDQNVIAKNSAIQVIFNNEEDQFNGKKFYFEKPELTQAWKAFDNIDQYLKYLKSGDMVKAATFVDTSYKKFDINKVNKTVKTDLGNSIVKTYNQYKHIDVPNKDSTKTALCFSIQTALFTVDSSEIHFLFFVPMNEPNKIIDVYSNSELLPVPQ